MRMFDPARRFLSAAAVLLMVGAATAQSPTFTLRVTVENSGVQASTLASSYTSGTSGAINTFNSANLPTSLASTNGYTSITSTSYTRVTGGTVSPIGGTGIDSRTSYSASSPGVSLQAADQYGGAGGTGKYLVVGPYTGAVNNATLQFSQAANYFGLWWSALDSANRIEFYNGSTLVDVLTADRLINFLGTAYNNNPNSGLNTNPNEKYAFVNIYDDRVSNTNRGFDQIVIVNNSTTTGNESDSHTISFSTTVPTTLRANETLVPVPEPAGLLAVAAGLVAVVRGRRWVG